MAEPAAPGFGVLLLSGAHDRAHYAFVLATGAAALGRRVTLFATNAGCRALLADWRTMEAAERDALVRSRGVAGLDVLREAAGELAVRLIACEAGAAGGGAGPGAADAGCGGRGRRHLPGSGGRWPDRNLLTLDPMRAGAAVKRMIRRTILAALLALPVIAAGLAPEHPQDEHHRHPQAGGRAPEAGPGASAPGGGPSPGPGPSACRCGARGAAASPAAAPARRCCAARQPAPRRCRAAGSPRRAAQGQQYRLPLPRFASLKTDEVNLRTGPGLRYPIDWVYKRRDLPVEIEREFEVWRLIADSDGVKGWVHQATLVGRRTFVVVGAERTIRNAPKDDGGAGRAAQARRGRAHPQLRRERPLVPGAGRRLSWLAQAR